MKNISNVERIPAEINDSRFQCTLHRAAAPLLCAVWMIAAAGCTCSAQKSDDEARLKKRIDTASVHLYAAAKAALASEEGDPALKEIARFLSVVGQADTPSAALPNLSAGDMLRLGKAVFTLKSQGAKIVRGEQDEGDALLRKVLEAADAKQAAAFVDRNMDHAALFLVESVLRLNEKSPVPIPDEIVLYEGFRTQTDSLALPGLAPLVLAFRSVFYGKNDFCDLAEKDAADAAQRTKNLDLMLQALASITEGAPPPAADNLKKIAASIRVIANAGPSYCRYQRGEETKARPYLKAMLDDINTLGVVPSEETKILDIFWRCGGNDEEIAAGKAALNALPKAENDTAAADRKVLQAYCDANAETKLALGRKILLSIKLAKLGLTVAQDARLINDLEHSKLYRAAFIVAAVCKDAVSASDGATKALDKLKGLFDKKDSE